MASTLSNSFYNGLCKSNDRYLSLCIFLSVYFHLYSFILMSIDFSVQKQYTLVPLVDRRSPDHKLYMFIDGI